jgi:hypothetical protein
MGGKKGGGGKVEVWELGKAGLSEIDLKPLCRVEGEVVKKEGPESVMKDDVKGLFGWIEEVRKKEEEKKKEK